MILKNGRVFTENGVFIDADVELKDGKIEITREPVQTEKFERYGLHVYPL